MPDRKTDRESLEFEISDLNFKFQISDLDLIPSFGFHRSFHGRNKRRSPRTISRQTKETKVHVELNLDGIGRTEPRTGVGFFDHMLDLLGRHSLIDLNVQAEGDLQIDPITPSKRRHRHRPGPEQALADKRGIHRYGWAIVPMDESLAQVAIDLSGRPAFVFKVEFHRRIHWRLPHRTGGGILKSLAEPNAKMNLLHSVPYGTNNHHIAEAIFKAAAKALRQAVTHDPRNDDVQRDEGFG